MAALKLKSLLQPGTGAGWSVAGLIEAMGSTAGIEDASGKLLLGRTVPDAARAAIEHDGATLGWATGPHPQAAAALASLLTHLAVQETERRALAGEVLHLYREVNLIERLSEQLSALLDLSTVGQSALDEARQLIAASSGSVLVLDEAGGALRSVASFGIDGDLATAAAQTLERAVGEIVNGEHASLLLAPLRAKQRTVGVIALGNTGEAPYFTNDLKLLNTIALQTAAAVENSFLCAEIVDAVRNREQLAAMQKELDTARTIQHSLIPGKFPPFPNRQDFELHAQMTAARSVGGDFFNYFLIDDDRLGVVIGDVSGKGIPAALYMAVTGTQITTIALEGMRPEHCLSEVNRALVREKASSMYATCFYGILHTRTGLFRCCNAGHNPPLLVRASGTVDPAGALGTGGLPLGLFDGPPYKGGSIQLDPGDTIFFYTDGVPEANNDKLDDFTDERMAQVVQQAVGLSCREMIDAVTREVQGFVAGAPQSDDITMVALRVRG